MAVCNVTGVKDEEDAASFIWIAGVLAAVLSSLMTSFGNIIQKIAQTEQQLRLEHEKLREPVPGIILSKRWLFGAGMAGIFPIPLDIAAFALAAQSVINPIGAVTLVFTQVIGPRLLERETVSRFDYLAGIVITLGVVFTTAFGLHQDTEYSFDDLIELWSDGRMIIVTIAGVASILGSIVLIKTSVREVLPVQAEPILFAFVAGGLGGLMNVLFKSVSELLGSQISGNSNPFGEDPLLCVLLIVVVIILAVGQLSFLNQGLKKFDAVLFSPLYSAMLIICGVLFGGIYYQEFDCFEALNWGMFLFGLTVSLAGIYMLTMGKNTPEALDHNIEYVSQALEERRAEHDKSSAEVHPEEA